MGGKIFMLLIVVIISIEELRGGERNIGNLGNISVDFGDGEIEEKITGGVEIVIPRRIEGGVRGMGLREIQDEIEGPEEYMWPIEWRGATSEWGYRRDPITGKKMVKHSGVDLKAGIGTPVYAPAPGVVRVAGWMTGYGKIVILDHAGGYSTRFAHLRSYSVKKGDSVRMGERIAATGNTGRSTGPHLHYEIRRDEVALNPMMFRGSKGSGTYVRDEAGEEKLEITLSEKVKKPIDI